MRHYQHARDELHRADADAIDFCAAEAQKTVG
jgi:hypothetical protein